jgi:hypothetical protein
MTITTIVVYAVAGLGVFGFVTWKVAVAVNSVRNKTLGLEAEMAAAEEINRLMQQGFTTFHDVPGEKHFNIDHVIVGPSGVYAVETKGRPKKARGSGKQGSTVRFDGRTLQFPGHREKKPLEQAKANADWLRRWLSSAVGESVEVHPVVLLPGWWVDRVGRGDVAVGNAKEISRIVSVDHQSHSITRTLQTRIVHQLDQRCRTIEPKAYAEA